jgi:hypothetical protein
MIPTASFGHAWAHLKQFTGHSIGSERRGTGKTEPIGKSPKDLPEEPPKASSNSMISKGQAVTQIWHRRHFSEEKTGNQCFAIKIAIKKA